MEVTETFRAASRAEWRSWLGDHHEDRSEIWLVTYRKSTGKPGVDYNDAVEEALCFGWIDSTRKALGEDRLAQRFTPRRAGSTFSQTNLERLARMREQGRVIPTVAAEVRDLTPELYVVPEDTWTGCATGGRRSSGNGWTTWCGRQPRGSSSATASSRTTEPAASPR